MTSVPGVQDEPRNIGEQNDAWEVSFRVHTQPVPEVGRLILLGNCTRCLQIGPINWYCSTCWHDSDVRYQEIETENVKAGTMLRNDNAFYALISCRESINGDHLRVFKPEALAILFNK